MAVRTERFKEEQNHPTFGSVFNAHHQFLSCELAITSLIARFWPGILNLQSRLPNLATVVAFCNHLCYIVYDRKWKIKNKM